jgi:hypothetical protein
MMRRPALRGSDIRFLLVYERECCPECAFRLLSVGRIVAEEGCI